ncbi:protein methyltransferase [Diplodia corticola]|uniref:Protein methyltransferase n=1 Tax=Diplodia corticola TaxID=236234 RepID=A0A1J9R8N2_9PEZI|nr:protein methyltransferase [Diplodia corticola]OJD37918.1 protein methyltransferase [Diplodia corticola]
MAAPRTLEILASVLRAASDILPAPARAVPIPADLPPDRCRTSRAIRLPRCIPMDSPASMEDAPIVYVGHHETRRSHPVTELLLRQAQDLGYDMLTVPVTNAHFHDRVLNLLSKHFARLEAQPADDLPLPLIAPITPDDTILTPGDTINQLLALSSPWIDLASPDPVIAHVSRQVFSQEVAYASFCGIGNIIVQGPKLHHGHLHATGVSQFARSMLEALAVGPYINIVILLPMVDDPNVESNDDMGHLAPFAREKYVKASDAKQNAGLDLFGTWDAWNIIRTVCKYNSRLSVALDLPRQLPPVSVQSRWFSEPLRLLSIPGSAFLKNKRGYDVLPVSHQALLTRYTRLRATPWLLLSDIGPIPGVDDDETLMTMPNGLLSAEAGSFTPGFNPQPEPTPAEAAKVPAGKQKQQADPTPHLSYIRHLQKNQPPKSQIERFGSGYQDFLQSPLQPLTDNLESITYEVFEKDPVKYEWYERAVEQALLDWTAQNKQGSGPDGKVVVAVAGAGRGPLVTRSLNASRNSGVQIDMWAVEKNPNAYVLLQRHNLDSWAGRVTVVKSDMRSWKGPHRADGSHGHVDILVSELLGSFADNELSPECLDGVQHVLNPTHGISIPASYTAHLTPLSAPKLHADINNRALSDPTSPETPHVVMLHQIDYLSTLPAASTTSAPASPVANGSYAAAANNGAAAASKGGSPETTALTPDVQLVWEFTHPLPGAVLAQARLREGGSAAGGAGGATGGDGANEHNARFSRMSFRCAKRGVCHGLGGYFEAVLYACEGEQAGRWGRKIELSTNPNTIDEKSKDMISWFPIYFPLKEPIYIPDDSEIAVSMWRQTDDRKVWYEWLIEAFVDVGGKKLRVAVSDLHSSKKNGCLM